MEYSFVAVCNILVFCLYCLACLACLFVSNIEGPNGARWNSRDGEYEYVFLPIKGMETKEWDYSICFERMGHHGMVMEDVKGIYLSFSY